MIELRKGDITSLKVNAIVNAANQFLAGGGGVDGAIHRAAGPELSKACQKIGSCQPGMIVPTEAFNIPVDYIIHTVGPIWEGGDHNEAEVLENCYRNCLSWSIEQGFKSIAFPNISTGVYGFPKKNAAQIAIKTVVEILNDKQTDIRVVFCCFDEENYRIYHHLLESNTD